MTGLCPGRVVVTLRPQLSGTQWEVAPEKGELLELSAESPCELREPEPSPFSSKRTMYETEEVRPLEPRGATWWLWDRRTRPPGAPVDVTWHQLEFHLFHHLRPVGSQKHPSSWGLGMRTLVRAGPGRHRSLMGKITTPSVDSVCLDLRILFSEGAEI